MQNSILKEIKIKLPDDIVNAVSSSEIISMLLDKALTKVEYYKSKCKEFEGKYNMDFSSFKKKVENAEEEEFAEWDDLMIWEYINTPQKEQEIFLAEAGNCYSGCLLVEIYILIP